MDLRLFGPQTASGLLAWLYSSTDANGAFCCQALNFRCRNQHSAIDPNGPNLAKAETDSLVFLAVWVGAAHTVPETALSSCSQPARVATLFVLAYFPQSWSSIGLGTGLAMAAYV
jgi:hypothetical protein